MKAGWEVKPLGAFSEIRYGYTAKANIQKVGPRFLRITDIQGGSVDWETVPYCAIDQKGMEKFSLSVGDIVFARTGATTGKSYLIQEETDAVFASYLIRVRATGEHLDGRFLSLFFQTEYYWEMVEKGTEGAAQGGFNATKLAELEIPLPPLEEQKRIVAVLDGAFDALTRARAHVEANLLNARELFESFRDNHLSGSAQIPLSEYLERITYGFTNPMPNSNAGPFKVTAKNVINGRIDYENTRSTTQDAFDQLLTDKSRPKVGDVLLTKDGTLGRTAVVDRDGLCVNQSVAVLTPSNMILPDYLNELLSCRVNQTAMIADAGGTTIKHLYITRVPKIKVFVPSLIEQEKLLRNLKVFQKKATAIQAHYQQKLTDLDDLRQSLLQKAFAGELT